MTPALVFDIETIPDVAGLRAAWDLADLPSDEAVAQAAFERRRLKVGHDFLPHHFQRIVAISCVFRDADGVRVRSLGTPQDDEPRLIQHFFRTVDRYKPQIVSWNGGGFDLPVLQYRAMIHGVPCPQYWETGENDRDFRYNNYLNRYHSRHLDLMDTLALFTNRANAPLDEIARLCGFPGKLGMDGSKVWDAWRAGQIARIREYCETDVASTWLLYCRFMLINGQLTPVEYAGEMALFRETIGRLEGPHWAQYLAAWPQ
jgi:predicted PolB exonuclease-like 3'-5' exonuclease